MRIFLNELMAGREHAVSTRSSLTLALLEDTGFYYADFCQVPSLQTPWTVGNSRLSNPPLV